MPLVAAGRATSAAPTYYPAATIFYDGNLTECVDGGVTINNPANECLEEIQTILKRHGKSVPRINVISIGTGKVTYNYLHGSNATGITAAIGNMSEGGIAINVKLSHKLVLKSMENLMLRGTDVSYYRLNPHLTEPIELDDSSPENIERLEKVVQKLISESVGYQHLIEHMCGDTDITRNQYIGIKGTEDVFKTFQ